MTGCVAGGCFGIRGRQLTTTAATAAALFMAEFQAFLRIVLAFRLYFTPSLLASLHLFSLYNQPILVSNRDALSDPGLLAASRGKTPPGSAFCVCVLVYTCSRRLVYSIISCELYIRKQAALPNCSLTKMGMTSIPLGCAQSPYRGQSKAHA